MFLDHYKDFNMRFCGCLQSRLLDEDTLDHILALDVVEDSGEQVYVVAKFDYSDGGKKVDIIFKSSNYDEAKGRYTSYVEQ